MSIASQCRWRRMRFGDLQYYCMFDRNIKSAPSVSCHASPGLPLMHCLSRSHRRAIDFVDEKEPGNLGSIPVSK